MLHHALHRLLQRAVTVRLEVEVEAEFYPQAEGANVIAEIPGRGSEVVMLGARQASEWQDAVAMIRHPIPAAFWQALRDAGLLPDHAPTPSGA